MENLIDDDLKIVSLMNLIVILMMKRNLAMNLMNNLLKVKKVF